MDKGIISYKHKHDHAQEEHPASACILPSSGGCAPAWACAKKAECGAFELTMGHIGEEPTLGMKFHTLHELKEVLNTMHLMVHKYEEEVAKWEATHPKHK